MSYLLLFFIKLYKILISPVLGTSCRFYPSCSNYMAEAIQKKGPLKGCWIGLKRLCKCHPKNPGGYDPVPDEEI